MLRARPTALCLLWLSPYTRALSVPPRRPPPSPRGRRAAESNYARRPSRGQPAGGGGGWRPGAPSVSRSWDEDEYDEDEQLPEVPDGEFLFGVNPVLAALKQRRRRMYRLLVQDSIDLKKRKDGAAVALVQKLAVERGVPVFETDKGRLNNYCGNRPHQGIVLQADPLEYEPMARMPPPPEPVAGARMPLWLALDEVGDPMNLGALLRSAHFLGVDGVLVSEKNSAPLTPVVSKASSGACEIMRVHATRNLPKTLNSAAEQGWAVVGAALEDSVAPSELSRTKPTVLVMGSEGAGLRLLVRRACSQFVRIPGGGSGDTNDSVDSLNVSVAGGILLFALLNP